MRIVARTTLAVVLVATALLKLEGGRIDDAVSPMWFLRIAGVGEIVLALTLAERWWRTAVLGVLALVMTGGGLLVWRMISGGSTVSSRCGCLGPIELPIGAYVSLLMGMGLLSLIALVPGGDSPIEEAASFG